MPPIPVEADAPPDLVTPLTASAAASASQARRSSSAVDGILGSSRSRSGKSRASNDGSARPTYLSSGATRAMATARSASLATPSPLTSLVETTAWRCPTSTRSPTSSPSERSDSSTRPSRTSTPCETPRTATASAASAPARLAASTSRCASVAQGGLIEQVGGRRRRTKAAKRLMVKRSRTKSRGLREGSAQEATANRRITSDVPDLRGFQAFSCAQSQRFSHSAARSRQSCEPRSCQSCAPNAGQVTPRLTSLFKRIRQRALACSRASTGNIIPAGR